MFSSSVKVLDGLVVFGRGERMDRAIQSMHGAPKWANMGRSFEFNHDGAKDFAVECLATREAPEESLQQTRQTAL